MYQPGVQTKRTVLNVFGPTGHGGRYILDALKVSHRNLQYNEKMYNNNNNIDRGSSQ